MNRTLAGVLAGAGALAGVPAHVRSRALAGILALGAMISPAWTSAAAPEACNRSCLEGYVDKYLEAMQSKTVSPALFARETKFTENGIRLPLGNEGLWFQMRGRGTYKFYIPDVETQQVAYIGTAREGGTGEADATPVAIALRLKIVGGLITQVEQLVVRPETSVGRGGITADTSRPSVAQLIEKMGSPNPIFTEVIPESRRPSREEMIKTANYYFAGLQRNDGKGYYPFTDDCDRYENGTKTTNVPMRNPVTGQTEVLGCKRQFEVGLKGVVSRIRDRRFVAVDRERGIVFAFGFFDHERINWTWQLAELFKIQDGKIRRIEAVFHRAPYGINSGWSTYEQGISEEPQIIR